MRILCGTDLLPKSDSALGRAGMLAERLGATLSVVHAVPRAEAQYLHEQEIERAGRSLRTRTAPPRWRHGPPPSVEVRAGHPVEVLADPARELDPALVVLGTSRRRLARDALCGTLAERLLRRVDCPVLLVRRMPWRAYRNVLLILDCAGSEEVVHAAGKLVLHGRERAALALAHEPFCAAAIGPGVEAPAVIETVGDYAQGGTGSRIALVHEHVMADPSRPEVRRLRPDLLIVGAGRRGWLRRSVLGDVVSRVLAMRGADALIVPRGRSCAAPPRRRPERGDPMWPFWLRTRGTPA